MSTPPGLRKRGNMIVRGSLALMIALLIIQALVHRAGAAPTAMPTVTLSDYPNEGRAMVYEFYGPHGVSCEIGVTPSTATSYAYCVTNGPITENVTVKGNGAIHICRGSFCGSNAGVGTPTYTAGIRIVAHALACTTTSDGVTCQFNRRGGFHINLHAITRLP